MKKDIIVGSPNICQHQFSFGVSGWSAQRQIDIKGFKDDTWG